MAKIRLSVSMVIHFLVFNTELIILEYKDKTQLADAKYDSEIDILDVTQIELIIQGQEKEMTFLDIFGEA